MSYTRLDLTGQRFGRLVCLEPATSKIFVTYAPDGSLSRKKTCTRWLCQCDCGNKHITYTNQLMSGNTRSCGCLRAEKSGERLRKIGKRERKHE